ncbi:pre-mRNA-processing factor 39-like [Anneissia japonica]|uniref:pre-mRNA-processing factor 39-like n=1 Tax=Anneissia japonica TaxID=1529436 RepID=UPI001425A31C|nr:pre-mRNA-processing factor 39-like [Anneissia japonica]
MESGGTDNDLSNPLFEKDLFGDSGADNGMNDDNLMGDLNFGGDAGLDPPFQKELENFLEATGFEETIDPPLAIPSGEESNQALSTSQTEEPMQTESTEDVSSAGNNGEHNTETNEDAAHISDVADDNMESEENEKKAMTTEEAVKVVESENKMESEEKEGKEVGKNEEKSKAQDETKDCENEKMEDDSKTNSNSEEKENEGKKEINSGKSDENDGKEEKEEEKEEENKEKIEEDKGSNKEKQETNEDKEECKEEDANKQDDSKDEKDDKSDDTKTKKGKDDKKSDKVPKELAHHWRAVNKNPTDFTSWSYLLHYVETEGHLPSARKAFEEFFSRYPYCYGYWKKYADLEKKNGNMDMAKEVFLQSLKAIPLSVELWIHFINFTMQATKDEDDRVDTIRKLFEQAIEAAGTDFKSDKLWDMYIKFEKEQKDWKRLTHIYDRLIRIPTQLYSHHFEKFKKHLNSQPIKEVLSDAEYEKLRSEFLEDIEAELEASLKEEDADVPGGDVAPPGLDDGPPGLSDEPPGVSDASTGEQPKKTTGASYIKQMKNETDQIKEKVLASRNAIHQETEQEVSKRWAFEEAIKRPYFHVKPLEKQQLKNWIEYLDFEIAEGMLERVVILFERCLIACALYEDLWLKYAKFMEPHSSEAVRSVYTRACTIHLPAKLNIVSHWAAFEETQGDFEKAREILEDLEKRNAKSSLITLRRINFERRVKCHDKALEVFKGALESSDKNKMMFNFYSCKLARYHYKILGEFDKAKEVLNEALLKDKDNPELYLQLLDLEFQRSPPNAENVMQLFQQAQKSGLDADTKFLFSQRRLEFLIDFGDDVNQLMQVIAENQKMAKSHQSALKKRAASAASTTEDATPPEKKAKTEAKAAGPVDNRADTTSGQQQQHTPQQYQQQQMQQGRPPPPQMMQQHPGPYNQPGYNYGAWNQYNQPPHNAYNYQQWGGYNQGYY